MSRTKTQPYRTNPAAKGRPRSDKHFEFTVTREEAVILQDALDDYAGDAGAGVKGSAAARLRALQRRLHTFTGEGMPPTPAARRESLRRLLARKGRQ